MKAQPLESASLDRSEHDFVLEIEEMQGCDTIHHFLIKRTSLWKYGLDIVYSHRLFDIVYSQTDRLSPEIKHVFKSIRHESVWTGSPRC
jgi:hypothetical protein